MAHNGTDRASNLDAAELDEALWTLRRGDVVRMLLPGRRAIALCTTLDEVRAAQRGQIPPGAVRLDGARR